MEFLAHLFDSHFHFLNDHLAEVFFGYGMTFLILGVVISIYPKKNTQYKLAGILWLFVAYALIHASADFLDMRAVVLGKNETLYIVGQLFTFISYGFLFEFGRRLLNLSNILLTWWLLLLLEVLVFSLSLSSSDFLATLNVLEGYLVRFPAGFMVGMGFFLYYRNNHTRLPIDIKKYFTSAVIAFWVWTFLCGIIRAKADFFPANWLNVESFLDVVGIPVYVFRAMSGLVVAWALIHILQIFDSEMKNKLAIEKTRFQITLESIGDGLFAIDVDGRFTFFNRIAEELTGEHREEVLGKSYREVLKFVREKDRSPNYGFIEDALTRNTITHIQNHTMLISKDGREIPVADSAAPIHDSAGNVTGCIVVFRDMTRDYAIDKAKTEFISLASHQLRTPLSAIKWSLETELDGSLGKLSGEQKEFLQNAYSAAQRMTILVDGLLNISRIEAERLVVKPEPTDLSLFYKQILTELQPSITQKEHEIQFRKPDSLPLVTTDPKLLHEVVANLLSNAIKYTPAKGTIVLSLELQGPDVVVSVKDNGLGIPKAQQQRVFEKFFRADNIVKVDTEGTGLGLYIVKRLVEILKGNVWFESQENQGTTFFVSIPLKGITGRAGEKSLA